MSKDSQILDYLWDNWDSHDLTIEKLISLADEIASEETLSEIWHLVSLKSMKKTVIHAKRAIDGGSEKGFIHDNLLFGYGFCNNDFQKRDLNTLVSYYKSHIECKPGSIISMRCLIEILSENRRYIEAEQRILEARQVFPHEQDLWEIYDVWIIWSEGKKEEAKSRLEYLSNSTPNNYLIQRMIADSYAKASEYNLALVQYERAFNVQHGKRKIDPLICLVKIHKIMGNNEKALSTVKRILEVYLNDYGIENGCEVEVWKLEEEKLIQRIEKEQLTTE